MSKTETRKSNAKIISDLAARFTTFEQLMEAVGRQTQQIGFLQRQLGLQLETILRIVDDDKHKMRQKFNVEFKKTVEFADFIQNLVSGEHANKNIKEKITLIREWNNTPNKVTFHTDYIGVREEISKHPELFTQEEIQDLGTEFNFEVGDLIALKQAEVATT